MNPQITGSSRSCPKCRAVWREGAFACWLCGAGGDAPLLSNPFEAPAPIASPTVELGSTFGATSTLLIVGYILLSIALFITMPGLGILAGVFAGPALIRARMVQKKRAERGVKDSLVGRIALFASSLFTILVIFVLVIVASVGTFCGVCLTAAGTGGVPDDLVIWLAGGAALIAFIFAVILGVRWFRFRWWRDTFEDNDH